MNNAFLAAQSSMMARARFIYYVILGFIMTAAPVLADVVSFEADSFPENEGWSRTSSCTPERSFDQGLFQQVCQMGECHPPPDGDSDSYTRSLGGFDGATTFFVEWRVETDGDRSEIDGAAPVVLSAWSFGPVTYWFAVARDRLKFVRDSFAEIVFLDLQPAMLHTFRLELYGDQDYRIYVDGQVAHTGVPSRSYPGDFPSISWRAKAWYLPNTTHWDYIRYGTIPEDGSGDFDSDGVVDESDVPYFLECLNDPQVGTWPGCRFADFDANGTVNLADYAEFQAAFSETPEAESESPPQ